MENMASMSRRWNRNGFNGFTNQVSDAMRELEDCVENKMDGLLALMGCRLTQKVKPTGREEKSSRAA